MTDSDRKLKEFKAVMKRQGFDTSGNYVKQGSKFVYVIALDINEDIAFKIGDPVIHVNIKTKVSHEHRVDISHGYINFLIGSIQRNQAKFLSSDK